MDAIEGQGRARNRFAYEWNADFATRQTKSYTNHNRLFYEAEGLVTSPDTAKIIQAFMSDFCKDSESYLYQAIEVTGFCEPAILRILEVGGEPQVTTHVALLDDRNEEGPRLDRDKKGTRREDKGALSSHQLYQLLKRKVGDLFESKPHKWCLTV